MRVMWACAIALLVVVACTGCASYDEWKCGGRGWMLRDGQCEGFGSSGFRYQRLDPETARRIEAGKGGK